MRLNDLPFRVYGDEGFRDKKCPTEAMEQITFFNRIRREYPDSLGLIATHIRNEGLRTGGQFGAVSRHRAEGMTQGAADIIIPGRVSFVCELKRRDRTLCQWQEGQIEYLIAAHNEGAWVCVAFGCEAAWGALKDWRAGL